MRPPRSTLALCLAVALAGGAGCSLFNDADGSASTDPVSIEATTGEKPGSSDAGSSAGTTQALIEAATDESHGSSDSLPSEPGEPDTRIDEERFRQLRALGYVTEIEIDPASRNKTGVTFHDPGRAYQGINAFCSENSGTFRLMDMEGRVLRSVTVEVAEPRYADNICKLAERYDDESVVMLVERTELVRVGLDSSVVWRWPGNYHHDVEVSSGGTVHAIRSIVDRSVPDLHPRRKIMDDAIVELSPAGETLRVFSLVDMVRFDPGLWLEAREVARTARPGTPGSESIDVFHVNTVELVRERIPIGEGLVFERGDILFCARNLDLIGVIDAKSGRIKWHWGSGELGHPHMPTLLPDGRVMVFDNGPKRGYSRVLSVSPATSQVVWEYKAKPPRAFFSRTRGSAEPLPNGNVLITESDRGHVFEITADGQVVWEYWNDDVLADGKKRATIFRMTRLDRDALTTVAAPGE